MKPFERKQLLERIEREGATVGHTIPEEITVDGEVLQIREFIFETKGVETVSPTEQERVDDVVTTLRRERLERKQCLENTDLSRESGERLADEIIGIDRALTSLESLEETDLEAESKQAERADRERWVTFLKRALGRDDGGGRGPHR